MMNRDTLVNIGAVVAIALGLVWLASVTEWVDQDVNTPAQGEALTNPYYAAEALLRQLGAKVVVRKSLDELPPAQARLLLLSPNFALLPQRAERMWRWVEQGGGQLVLSGNMLARPGVDGELPIFESDAPSRPLPQPAANHPQPGVTGTCRPLSEPAETAYAPGRPLRICAAQSYVLTTERPVLWRLDNAAHLAEAMRVRHGAGTITAIAPRNAFENTYLLLSDNALLLAAALQLHAGDEVWLVSEESRPSLPVWLWHNAWIAGLLGLLALAAALWRQAVRFGPRVAIPPLARRSMREQVAGTAEFLRRHGVAALHRAQARALDQAAARRLRGYAALDTAARAEAIARHIGFHPHALAKAMARQIPRGPQDWAQALQLMEAARRRLLAGSQATPPPPL